MRWDITGSTQHGYHALLVTKVENGQVYMRNPWGSGDNSGTAAYGPPREVLDNQGSIRLAQVDFLNCMVQVSVSA